jgi:branched-chain amino acid transport system substrate-binding protein
MAGRRRRITASGGVIRPASGLTAALLVALALAACGGARHAAPKQPPPVGNRIAGRRLTVYVSAPMRGPSALSGQAVLNGATLALNRIHARIGRYRILLRSLDDVPVGGTAWNGAAATLAAQTAAANPTTIAYLGDLNSGATAVSLPILNRLGIAQVSPYSGAVGLTFDGPGSSPGEPQAYYPTSFRTFARVVPSDYVQARAQVAVQQQLGCTETYVLTDGEYDGAAASAAFTAVAQQRRLQLAKVTAYLPTASSYLALGQSIAASGANCLLVAAITGANAVALVKQVAAANPQVRLFATSGLAESGFVDPMQGGLPETLDSRLIISAPTGNPAAHNRLRSGFASAYGRAYGTVEPAASDGYAAMQLLIGAIRHATDNGKQTAERVRVAQALFEKREHASVLGRYRITKDGDTSLDSYDLYKVAGGALRYWKTVKG